MGLWVMFISFLMLFSNRTKIKQAGNRNNERHWDKSNSSCVGGVQGTPSTQLLVPWVLIQPLKQDGWKGTGWSEKDTRPPLPSSAFPGEGCHRRDPWSRWGQFCSVFNAPLSPLALLSSWSPSRPCQTPGSTSVPQSLLNQGDSELSGGPPAPSQNQRSKRKTSPPLIGGKGIININETIHNNIFSKYWWYKYV